MLRLMSRWLDVDPATNARGLPTAKLVQGLCAAVVSVTGLALALLVLLDVI